MTFSSVVVWRVRRSCPAAKVHCLDEELNAASGATLIIAVGAHETIVELEMVEYAKFRIVSLLTYAFCSEGPRRRIETSSSR